MGFVKRKRFHKALSEAAAVVQRAAKEQHAALYAPALGKTGNGLINNSLIYACSNILLTRALIEQRLYVRFGKHAAAGGDWIYTLVAETEFVQLFHSNIEERSHLVDERACAACAGAVHALIYAAVKEYYLGILAAEFYHASGLRRKGAHDLRSCEYFLHKGDIDALRKAETRRAGYGDAHRLAARNAAGFFNELPRLLTYSGKMALVFLKYRLTLFHQHRLCGSGANIQTEIVHQTTLFMRNMLKSYDIRHYRRYIDTVKI